MKNHTHPKLGGFINKLLPFAVMLRSCCSASQPLSKKQRDPEQKHLRMTREVAGFTLIELLVVVLIIGILSAIALPQYQKAVVKARATELQTLARALATAQSAYFMANSQYADDLDKLDLSFPFTRATELAASFGMTDGALNGDKSAIAIKSDGAVASIFTSGPYAYKAGFAVQGYSWGNVKAGELYCTEMGTEVDFCHKFYGGTVVDTDDTNIFYSMP